MKRVAKEYRFLWIFLVVGLVLPLIVSGNYYIVLFNQMLVNMVVVLGLNFITGMTRNMNLGTAGIMCLGAYTSTLLTTKLGLPSWLGLLGALAMGYIVGQALGYPSLRVRGVYLSLTTIAFTEIVRLFVNNTKELTNGTLGIRAIPGFHFFGLKIESSLSYYYFMLAFAAIALLLALRISRSKWGRAFRALSDNPDAAESLGINIAKVKVLAFTLCAIFGSVAGALYAHMNTYIDPSTFTFNYSVKFVIMLMAGGIGLVEGNIFGAIMVTLMPELLRFLGDYYQIVFYTVVFIGAIVWPNGWPKGFMSLCRRIVRRGKGASAKEGEKK